MFSIHVRYVYAKNPVADTSAPAQGTDLYSLRHSLACTATSTEEILQTDCFMLRVMLWGTSSTFLLNITLQLQEESGRC